MKNDRGEISIPTILIVIVLIVIGGVCIFMLTGEDGVFVPKRYEQNTNQNQIENTTESENNSVTDKDETRKFGLNVVYYRKRMRITQLELAELLDIQRSHISAVELGNVGVSLDLIFKMCDVFQIKPSELFDFRD